MENDGNYSMVLGNVPIMISLAWKFYYSVLLIYAENKPEEFSGD